MITIQETFSVANKIADERAKEAFDLIWKLTPLEEDMKDGLKFITIYIPEGKQKTSWDADLFNYLWGGYNRMYSLIFRETRGKLSFTQEIYKKGFFDSGIWFEFAGKWRSSNDRRLLKMQFILDMNDYGDDEESVTARKEPGPEPEPK